MLVRKEDLVLVFLLCYFGYSHGIKEGGLYISNSTHILFSESKDKTPVSVFKQETGRIVGVTVDPHNALLFWSDVGYFTRGIYKAPITDDGTLGEAVRIIESDLLEVNAVSVDYVSKHVYWTDGRKKTIEVAEYDGTNRRTLLSTDLLIPRGIVADPRNGYLFWNDQGSRKIERSNLDGSDRLTLVENGVEWPNQMSIHHATNWLLWVDAKSKKLFASSLSGLNVEELVDLSAQTDDNPIYGLAIKGDTALVTAWQNGKALEVNIQSGAVVQYASKLGTDVLFSAAVSSTASQPLGTVANECSTARKGDCSNLCLPTINNGYRCSCPSYGGLTLAADGKNCAAPDHLLFYALGDSGEVGFYDLANLATPDRYIVGRSLRPVSVAYDHEEKKVYWSDVHERAIHVANLDGSGHALFLTSNSTVGIVDGLAVDSQGRRLYFSNMDMVAIEGASYGWHKIEAIGLDGNGRRTVVETAERPRGLFVDREEGFLYYTDWGSQASVTRVHLDGSSPELMLLDGLQNPNSVLVVPGAGAGQRELIIADSFYKSRKKENLDSYGPERDGKLFRQQIQDGAVTEINLQVKTPFGLAMYGSKLFISDWTSNSIIQYDTNNQQQEVLLQGAAGPMGLLYAQRVITETSTGVCSQAGCKSLCFDVPSDQSVTATCTCDSYDASALGDDLSMCEVPTDNVIVADFHSLRLQGLDMASDDSLYNIAGGDSFTNIVALLHDDVGGMVYFSDVNRRAIFKSTVATGKTELFLDTEDIIDGMVANQAWTKIYWTDFYEGKIGWAALDGSDSGVLVRGLDRPRAVVLDEKNNHIYWTEWGSKPRVARAFLSDGTLPRTIVDDDVVNQPNGLAFGSDPKKLYVGEATVGSVAILECTLKDGSEDASCVRLPYTVDVPLHIYSLRIIQDHIFYSDWLAQEIAFIDMVTGIKRTVVDNLMRPAEFAVTLSTAGSSSSCPPDNPCSHGCRPHPGNDYSCTCPSEEELIPDPIAPENCVSYEDIWEPVPSLQDTCAKGTISVRKIGSTQYKCVCGAGKAMQDDGKCQGCSVGYYQPYMSDKACRQCPGQSSTSGTGATSCHCGNTLAWDYKQLACSGVKPGECPRIQIASAIQCEGTTCQEDADCPGAMRCCSNDACPTALCRDPVGLWECFYQGVVFNVGQEFQPDECTHCTCQADKFYASGLYGGANCKITNCPTLDCPDDKRIVPTGRCCPICKETDSGKVVTILNCPTEPLELVLPVNMKYAKLEYKWGYKDELNRQSLIRVIQTPPDQYLPWLGNDVTQSLKVEVKAPKTNGFWDSDTCSFEVIVKDKTAPLITCPSDIRSLVKDPPKPVMWSPAQFQDNVCTVETCIVGSVPKFGSDMPVGTTNVQYIVEDQAGNKAQCSFDVVVRPDESNKCLVPDIYNGYLDCETSTGGKNCTVKCNEGYTVHRTPMLKCDADIWSPSIGGVFTNFACVKRNRRVFSGRIDIDQYTCPAESPESFNLSFQEEITDSYLGTNTDISVSVSSEGCGAGDEIDRNKRQTENSMKVSIKLEGESEDPDGMNALIKAIMKAIDADLKSCDLRIHGDGSDCKVGSVQTSITEPLLGCRPGEEEIEDYCIVCPVGSYDSKHKCEPCPENEYQQLEGQMQCDKCQDKTGTETVGNVMETQCVPIENPTTSLAIIIGAVVAGVVVLIVIIIVVVVCCCCCHRGNGKDTGEANSYANNAFDPENALDQNAKVGNEYDMQFDGADSAGKYEIPAKPGAEEYAHDYQGLGE